jgi:hypothetical protein
VLVVAERQRRQGRRGCLAGAGDAGAGCFRPARRPAPCRAPGGRNRRPARHRAVQPGSARPRAASGKPVFLYFTADWCLSCKVNESVAIDREATAKAFAKAGVQVIVGDWTRADPAITASSPPRAPPACRSTCGTPRAPPRSKLPQVLTPQTLPDLLHAPNKS